MQRPNTPKNEAERQKVLDSYQILDTLAEESFDDLTLIASQICQTPIALISLVDKDRQWFKSKFGLEANETHRDISFCAHAINEPVQIFEVENANEDNRFADNPLVTGDPNIGFYAGIPLLDNEQIPLGTLCVIDQKPRILTVHQKKALKALAKEVMNRMELRKTNLSLQTEIQQNKKELSHFESKYFTLYNKAPDMMASIDAETKCVIECNEILLERLGYRQDEVIGKAIFELYHPDCLQEVKEAFNSFISEGTVKNKRLSLRAKNNTKINVALNVTAVKDENGTIVYSSSVWRDIEDLITTEKQLLSLNKQLETKVAERTRELNLQKERLELASKGARDGVLDWININADEHWWSPTFLEILGYKDGEIEPCMSNFLNILLHPDDLSKVRNLIQRSLRKNRPFDVEFRLKTKSENYKWFRGRGSVICIEDGTPYRMTGSVSDIDQQKKLELELKETQDFLTKVTDIAPSIIYIFNQQTMSNEYANRELGEVLGYTTEEVQEMGAELMPKLCHPDDLSRVFGHFARVAQLKNNEIVDIEYRMKHKDGNYRWLLSEDTTFERDNNGKLIKQLGVATDITKLKLAQIKLEQQAKELRLQNEELKQFAYIAMHDMKNPMLTLEGHFNFLKTQFNHPTQDVKDSIGFIEEEMKLFTNVVEGLNNAIKIRELNVNLDVIDLASTVKVVIDSYQRKIDQIKGTFKIDLDKSSKVLGTDVYVKSIVQNLISNAIKYHSSDRLPDISIATKLDGDWLYLYVADNGLGVDTELHKDRLFKMFNRFHHQSEGNGIGLYLIKQMIEKMGGTVALKSKINEGSIFTLKFKSYKG